MYQDLTAWDSVVASAHVLYLWSAVRGFGFCSVSALCVAKMQRCADLFELSSANVMYSTHAEQTVSSSSHCAVGALCILYLRGAVSREAAFDFSVERMGASF